MQRGPDEMCSSADSCPAGPAASLFNDFPPAQSAWLGTGSIHDGDKQQNDRVHRRAKIDNIIVI